MRRRVISALFAIAFVILLSCNNCPVDTCPGPFDVGQACTSRGLCSDNGHLFTSCVQDSLPYAAPDGCDITNLAANAVVDIDVAPLRTELGTRNDFSASFGEALLNDPSVQYATWTAFFDGVPATSCTFNHRGCFCENVPITVNVISISTNAACAYMNLTFTDQDCVHPECEK
jgi:hypothetical protein